MQRQTTMMPPSGTPEFTPAEIRRAVLASVIGNGLEWFDFLIYGFFAAVISQKFFPARDPTVSIILTMATFAVGFIVRPVGGVLLGIYADRVGRRRALSLLILMMAAGTLLIGITPSYDTIGLAAPLLVVFSRVLQGLSVGGEFSSATAMLVEYAKPDRKSFYASFQMSSQGVAAMLASAAVLVLTGLLSASALNGWAWRIPFLLGAVVGPVGFYIRRRVAESPEFAAAQRKLGPMERVGFGQFLSDHTYGVVMSLASVSLATAANYIWNIYLPVFVVKQLHLPLSVVMLGVFLGALILLIGAPLVGRLADRVGPGRVVVTAMVVFAVIAYPLFAFVALDPTPVKLIVGQVVAAIALVFIAGSFPGFMAAQFPVRVRSTGLAIAYNLAVLVFGGLSPLTVSWLFSITHNPLSAAYYLLVVAVVALVLISLPRLLRGSARSPA
jgi:MFS transporter, MHS family, proline/betaine transporter